MSYMEDVLKLRKRIIDAVQTGIVNKDGKDFLEAALIQIMNEAEKNRQNCTIQAENLRKQASVMDGQAGAFNSVISIVYNVIHGFVSAEERAQEERTRQEEERKLKEESVEEIIVSKEQEVIESEEILPRRSSRKK